MKTTDNPDLSVRKCKVCKKTRLNSSFHKALSGVNGRFNVCKDCRKIIEADKYKTNRFLYLCRLKKSYCKLNNIVFDLTPEYLSSIYTEKCPVFNEFFSEGKKGDWGATLDRVDPSKGYTQGNVCFISHRANRIKYDSTIKELEQILDWYKRATTRTKVRRSKWTEAVDPHNCGDDIV